MNILPKKSWHVRNKDNIAKVRRDELEAANQEKNRLEQIALAEQEARTQLLRNKARKRQSDALHSNTIESSTSLQPINFFQKLGPDGQPYSSSATNAEHEKEKLQEKEKAEKKLGVLQYLGQSAVESLPDDERPWYFKAPSRAETSKDLTKFQIFDNKRKAQLDPLNNMKEHLKKKKKKHKHEQKHRKPSKGHSTLKSHHSQPDAKYDKLAKLRKERMEREAKEKQRSHQLLQKHFGSAEDSNVLTESSTFVPKYSNQFNPQIARNNKYT